MKSITVTGKDSYCTEMMKRLDIQRRNELFCDVIVEVGSVDDQARLKAHRNVLCAASPFFYDALNSDMKENKEGEIRLEETSKALIEELIDYLYSGHVEVTKENAKQLFAQADCFLIPSLKALSIVDTAGYRTETMKGLHIQRKNGHFCDMTLEVVSGDGQALLKAHRNVLCAASPFFYTVLNSDMKEKKDGVIRLKETTNSVMEQILEFLYTGHVEVNNEENAYELLTQADYFLIPSLKALSGKFIVQTLDVSNCLVVYNFAIDYHGEELKNGVRDFILANLVAVSDTEDFLNVSGKEIEEWISSDEVIVKQEEEIFEMIVKWMEKKKRQDQDFLQLLRHVRCVFVSHSYVFDVMLQHPLVKANAVCSEFILDAMKEVPDDHTDQCFFSQSPRNCLKTYEDAIVASGERGTICYIPSEDKWYKLADKLSRNYFYRYCMSSLRGKLYVIGKCIDQNGNNVEYYDPSSNLWTPVSAPGIVKRDMAVVTLQGLLYVVGGRDENDIALSTVQRYNPDAD